MSADKVSAAALGIGLEPVPASTTRACAPAPSPGSEPIPVPPGGTVIRAGSEPVRVGLRRYADHEFPVRLGTVAAGAAAALAIPRTPPRDPGGWSSAARGRPWSARWGRERERRRGDIGERLRRLSATRDSRSPCSRLRPSSRAGC